MRNVPHLSEEQQIFVNKALTGNNILVNACIGSGKTTAIQLLCDRLPPRKKILYLTYNRLLKLDAQAKIRNTNVKVQNYNGIAASYLYRSGFSVGVSDQITRFNELKPPIDHYDILIIDEYQDIETEHSILLEHIKSSNPNIQIIAVGDMHQKIYDKTNLNVSDFINQFLGKHIELEFTQCFRLSANLAEKLGRIWCKKIVGVNQNCIVEEMNMEQVSSFLSIQQPQDILCLGSRNGALSRTLNNLELKYSDKFNKQTVYASISDNDSLGTTIPTPDTAIFTTFDSSKGLERKICVIFDFTESYWEMRISKPQQSYDILRNIFCVAASRGKTRIIFVNSGEAMLSESTLSTRIGENKNLSNVNISSMFDFKYREDIEKCFSLLQIEPISTDDNSIIEVKSHDGMIDLSPCIGTFQEAMYFKDYNIDRDIELHLSLYNKKRSLWTKKAQKSSIDSKILLLASMETNQDRYRTQVELPFIDQEATNKISDRLFTRLKHSEKVQVGCIIPFSDKKDGESKFIAGGFADVVKENIVYELKFVSSLSHEHFLQCACYVIGLNLEKGILWNTRDNTSYEIKVPDKKAFLDAVVNAITKNKIKSYFQPSIEKKKNTLPPVLQKSHKFSPYSVPKEKVSKYCVGVKVRHKDFGEGEIVRISELEQDFHLCVVRFKKNVIQRLFIEICIASNLISIVSEDNNTTSQMDTNNNVTETKEQMYKNGYEDVKNLFIQQSTPIRDRYKKRWIKCETCNAIKQDDEFSSYGGDNRVNLGICSECRKKARNNRFL